MQNSIKRCLRLANLFLIEKNSNQNKLADLKNINRFIHLKHDRYRLKKFTDCLCLRGKLNLREFFKLVSIVMDS